MIRKNNHPILALDPGLRDLGYAILAGKNLLASNVIPLRNVPRSGRIKTIQEVLTHLIRGYRPRTLVLEHIPKRPLDTLAGLPALARRLRRLAKRLRLSTAVYSARAARRTVVGDGWAGKRQAAEILSKRFPDLRVHLTHDRKWKERYWQNMFDAVALGLHHQALTKPPSRSR
jgi:Holliday junction resolvasome RuvABC endonuclease subunit